MSASTRCFIRVDEPASGLPYTIASPNSLSTSSVEEGPQLVHRMKASRDVEARLIRVRHLLKRASLKPINPIQAVEGHALEAGTWSFHVAVEHLASDRGTTADRLSACIGQLSTLKPNRLHLPGSLIWRSLQLIEDLKAGRYSRDASSRELAVRDFHVTLQAALLETYERG